MELLLCTNHTLIYSICTCIFFFNDTATTEIYTLSLHDALPISPPPSIAVRPSLRHARRRGGGRTRSGGGARAGVACREGLQPRRRERVRLVVGDRTIRGARSAASAPGPHDVGFRSALGCWPPPTGRRAVYSASHVHLPPGSPCRSLGRPAAAPAGLLERGRGAGRLDHRRRDLPYAGRHRREIGRASCRERV